MIKGIDKGEWSCVAANGKKKKTYQTQDDAIQVAKYVNSLNGSKYHKQVAYKCPHCHQYHLTTSYKKFTKL